MNCGKNPVGSQQQCWCAVCPTDNCKHHHARFRDGSGHSFFSPDIGNHVLSNLFACHETNEAGDIFGVDELVGSHQFPFFVLGNSFQKDTFCVQIQIPIKFPILKLQPSKEKDVQRKYAKDLD